MWYVPSIYTSFLISVIFLNIGLKIISIFSSLIVQQLGGGSESFGMVMFICGLLELPTFIGVTDYFGVKVMSGLLVGVFLLTLIAFIPHLIYKEKIEEE